ncbi:MAG: LiaF transmembrane domain-containing protein [Smithella sp.]
MAGSKHHMLTGGLILIALGVLIYLSKAGIYSYSQTWPVLIIVIGFGTIIQKASDLGGWFITIAGVLFLIVEFYGFDLHKYSQYILPAVLILLGIFVILRRKKT